MPGRRAVAAVVGVGALALAACGTRVPHSRVVAADEAHFAMTGVPAAAGSAGAVAPSSVATLPNGQTSAVPVGGSTVSNGVPLPVVGRGGAATSQPGRQPGAGGRQHGGGPHSGDTSVAGGDGVITARCPGTGSGTIKLGSVGPYSASGAGPVAGPGRDILSVWAAWVNAHGGICGRQVQMLTRDDQGSAAERSAIVKDLVENQHVVALVGDENSLVVSAEQSYLESKQIPVVGGDISTGVWFKSPVYFPQGAQNNEMLYRGMKAAQGHPNGTKLAFLYCAEITTCVQSYHQMVNDHLPERAGDTMVYSKEVSITQISFAAECQAAQKAGAGVILPGGDASFVERVANSCGQQGYHFAYIADGMAVGESQKDNQYLNNNLFVPTQTQPWMATNTPGARLYDQELAQFGPGVQKTGVSASNFVAALVAQQAITAIGGGEVTPASIMNALHHIRDFTAGGLTGPLTYHPGAQSSNLCTGLATVVNHQFVAAYGGNLTCRTGAPMPLPQ